MAEAGLPKLVERGTKGPRGSELQVGLGNVSLHLCLPLPHSVPSLLNPEPRRRGPALEEGQRLLWNRTGAGYWSDVGGDLPNHCV